MSTWSDYIYSFFYDLPEEKKEDTTVVREGWNLVMKDVVIKGKVVSEKNLKDYKKKQRKKARDLKLLSLK